MLKGGEVRGRDWGEVEGGGKGETARDVGKASKFELCPIVDFVTSVADKFYREWEDRTTRESAMLHWQALLEVIASTGVDWGCAKRSGLPGGLPALPDPLDTGPPIREGYWAG